MDQPSVALVRGARLRLALLPLLRFCRLAFGPWEALRLRVDWLRCVMLAAASVPSAARRGAASAGAMLVAKTKPPIAAISKNFFIIKRLPMSRAGCPARFARFRGIPPAIAAPPSP